MPKNKKHVIQNQVFIGLPWKTVRTRYEKAITKLCQKYPLSFTIVGRNHAQDAEDLLEVIKDTIAVSSYAIFDATGGNANVSLEYGYAEGLEIPRCIYISVHKATKPSPSGPIISDLGGKRRVQYTNEKSLTVNLETFCKNHDFTKRFNKFLDSSFRGSKPGKKKRSRSLALKLIHHLAEKDQARRDDLVQHLQAGGYQVSEIDDMIKRLHNQHLTLSSQGRYSTIRIA